MIYATTPIVVKDAVRSRGSVLPEAFHHRVSLGLWAAALVFLIGSVLDLVILWGLQRQSAPQWEFTALASTAEGLPRIVLGLALAWLALYVRGSTSLIGYRLLALGAILVGLAGAIIGGLMTTDFFILRASVNPEAVWLFRSTVIKTLALAALYVFVVLPIGVLAMRRPRM